MTTKNLTKSIALVLAMTMLCPMAMAAQRVKTFSEALEKAGSDGIVMFCYGPDWNRRSVRMLDEFWKTAAAEQACGNAAMVAVPFYQDPEADKKNEAADIAAGAPNPPGGICPTVLMLDKNGKQYAKLAGTDDLGDFQGGLGVRNIKDKLAAFRKQQELLAKAETLSGQEKSKVLWEISELPITPPSDLLAMAEAADPSDTIGLVRRLKFNPLLFMYGLLGTTDGFMVDDYVPDFPKIQREVKKVVDDTALRPEDRQRVLAFLIGESRRQGVTGNKFTALTKQMAKISDQTVYGKIANFIGQKWGVPQKKTPLEIAKAKQLAKEAAKEDKQKLANKKKLEKKAERTIEID